MTWHYVNTQRPLPSHLEKTAILSLGSFSYSSGNSANPTLYLSSAAKATHMHFPYHSCQMGASATFELRGPLSHWALRYSVGADSFLTVCLHQQALKAQNSLSWTPFVLSLWTPGHEHLTWEAKLNAVLSARHDQQHMTTESPPHDPRLQPWETHWDFEKWNKQPKTKIQTCTKYLHVDVYKTLRQVFDFICTQTDRWHRSSKNRELK